MILIGPKKFVSKANLISDSDVSSNGPVIPIPALFINISILPSFFRTKLTTSLIWLTMVISHFNKEKSIISYFLGSRHVPYTLNPLEDK